MLIVRMYGLPFITTNLFIIHHLMRQALEEKDNAIFIHALWKQGRDITLPLPLHLIVRICKPEEEADH